MPAFSASAVKASRTADPWLATFARRSQTCPIPARRGGEDEEHVGADPRSRSARRGDSRGRNANEPGAISTTSSSMCRRNAPSTKHLTSSSFARL